MVTDYLKDLIEAEKEYVRQIIRKSLPNIRHHFPPGTTDEEIVEYMLAINMEIK
ncbi:MAG: hypothetical protein Q4F74_03850 [Synergistaceae bacterium]|nr:hypothetical protein [Synergistaceae bacterium]